MYPYMKVLFDRCSLMTEIKALKFRQRVHMMSAGDLNYPLDKLQKGHYNLMCLFSSSHQN